MTRGQSNQIRRSIAITVALGTALLLGCGSRTSSLNSAAATSTPVSSGGSGSGSGSSTNTSQSSGGTVISNVQALSQNWRSWVQAPPDYVDCSASCSEATWDEIYGVADPSVSGNATQFSLVPNIPYADALFAAGLIGQTSPQLPDSNHTLLPTLHNFIYQTSFYIENPAVTQALEFDIVIQMNGVSMNWGHQCSQLGDGTWDIWDNVGAKWVSTGIPCQFAQGWNHLTLKVQREPDNSLLYQSITLNGTTYPLNKTYLPGTAPSTWWGLSANFQIDSNSTGAANSVYMDNFSFTYW